MLGRVGLLLVHQSGSSDWMYRLAAWPAIVGMADWMYWIVFSLPLVMLSRDDAQVVDDGR